MGSMMINDWIWVYPVLSSERFHRNDVTMNDSQQTEPPSFAETSFVEMMMYVHI